MGQTREAGEPGELEAGAGGYVQSLARGLAVIAAFDADNPQMTLSEVARRTGLSRATARRFLLTLEHLGYVRSDGREFALTPQVMRLGFAYLSSQSLPDVAQPHLTELSRQLQESTSVAVLDGDDITYVARQATRRIMTVAIRVGTRFPAYATSMGRVLLADFDEPALQAYLERVPLVSITSGTLTDPAQLRAELGRIRDQGYAVVDQELELGLRSIAAPIRDGAGRVVAAVNVSTGVLTPHGQSVEQLLEPLLETAAKIEGDLRAQGR
ncbi:IclR family transcriptional regulator domain-containing protein [Kineosphaera limosa]|uniref:IclR family transcriptional regulator domain-containing protein n=1 Tax=Kineosphaera limosa TaxID=111564 RepID=UPI0006910E12|nr:IclR family transcriptional regulator C-terminal domain-containing protein [Kineosphaera limosa]